jgi:hypothetical protein
MSEVQMEQQIESKTLAEIEQEIGQLVVKYKEQSLAAHPYLIAVEETLLDVGYQLAAAYGNTTDSEYDKLKKETAAVLEVDSSTINKVIKTARNPSIKKYKDRLPSGWTCLYLLCQMGVKEFDVFMQHSKVDASTTRSHLLEMIKNFKAAHPEFNSVQTAQKEPKHKIERLSLKQINSNSIDIIPSAELEPLLKQFLLTYGWELVKSEPKPQSIAPASSTVIEGESHANNEQDFEHQNVA